ncbi:hypothetical protein GRI62_10325 [Erythrobacter arachoides]|uniref:HTH luxR-type domain-containing protein n=1 Tax=Aurantiacibacter arachoides TaxID=1850444 RepID=A0A845A4C4_9SPHN|nr:helix-turn-helix transcriptional regulator [Aurantiacibacter arachoides]MXO93996.1 hypothetical protein [Aurantiacibacter arachoides]GGD44927.1 hypothetical protein GCM10011411_00700 [Aurantiacibacter arachoides]
MQTDGIAFAPHLTPRQLDCLALVKKGLTSRQVARELGISHRTVETHVAGAIEALQVNNRMAAVTRLDELKREHREAEKAASTRPFMLGLPYDDADAYLVAFTEPEVSEGAIQSCQFRFFPPLSGTASDISAKGRLRWIVRIAAAGIMLTCMSYLSIIGVSEIAAASSM